jgi:hypothetical protein
MCQGRPGDGALGSSAGEDLGRFPLSGEVFGVYSHNVIG